MQKRKSRARIVKEDDSDWGIYIWIKQNGRPFGDGQGNVMNIKASRYDIVAINKLRDAARAYGVELGGHPQFMPGCRPVSDMEYSEQQDRMRQGYIPSETDFGAWKDAQRTSDKVGGIDEDH